MTMLNRRRRSSADKAGAADQADTDPKDTQQIDKDQVDAEQADTERADTDQADDTVREGAEQAEADTEHAEAEPVSDDAEETAATRVSKPSRGGHRRSRVRVRVGLPLLIGLAVVAMLLGAGATVLWVKGAELKGTDDASQQAVHAASQAARDLSSYDYRTLESDFKTASNQTTGSLHDEYDALAQQIRATAVQQQAVSQTVVIKAGVQSATPDQVKVLVYANRSATTTASPNRLPEPLRILMTMVKVSGRWLAKDLQVL